MATLFFPSDREVVVLPPDGVADDLEESVVVHVGQDLRRLGPAAVELVQHVELLQHVVDVGVEGRVVNVLAVLGQLDWLAERNYKERFRVEQSVVPPSEIELPSVVGGVSYSINQR